MAGPGDIVNTYPYTLLQEMVVRTKDTESLTPYLHPGGNDGIQVPWQHVPLYLPPGDG